MGTPQRVPPERAAELYGATITLTAAAFAMPKAELLRSRGRHAVLARQTAMYILHVNKTLSYAAVARLFKYRSANTVVLACAKIEDARDDAAFDALVTAIEDESNGR
ncbi:MAG: helix-turn-helix domain-containing protein [Methyloceanibacter sp.]